MVDALKKNFIVVIILLVTLILGILAIVTAIRIRTTQPVAPTVPQKKPQAAENLCTLDFEIGAPPAIPGAPSGGPSQAGHGPELAFDQNGETFWAGDPSGFNSGGWTLVNNYGKTHPAGTAVTIEYYWKYYPGSATLEVSSDGTTWTKVADVPNEPSSSYTVNQTFQSIRMVFKPGGDTPPYIREIWINPNGQIPQPRRCKAAPDQLNYLQLKEVDAKPVSGFPDKPLKLPLPQEYTFSMKLQNTGYNSFTAKYYAEFNKCTSSDLNESPWKCSGPRTSDFTTIKTVEFAPGETKTISFSSADIVCGQRYQYDIFVPLAGDQFGAQAYGKCGPEIAGTVEFTCVTPTPTPSPTITPSPTPTLTPTPIPQCNDSCSSNAQCPANLTCSSGRCRNPQCTGESSCNCPSPTATPTPPPPTSTPPPSCNSSCTDNAGCPSSMICSNGVCRNPQCTQQTNCSCPAPTTPPQTKGGQPVAPKTPEAGTFAPTAILILAGGAILLLGAIL